MKMTQGSECADIENNDWEGGGGRNIRIPEEDAMRRAGRRRDAAFSVLKGFS